MRLLLGSPLRGGGSLLSAWREQVKGPGCSSPKVGRPGGLWMQPQLTLDTCPPWGWPSKDSRV